jgi:hypothetical protein
MATVTSSCCRYRSHRSKLPHALLLAPRASPRPRSHATDAYQVRAMRCPGCRIAERHAPPLFASRTHAPRPLRPAPARAGPSHRCSTSARCCIACPRWPPHPSALPPRRAAIVLPSVTSAHDQLATGDLRLGARSPPMARGSGTSRRPTLAAGVASVGRTGRRPLPCPLLCFKKRRTSSENRSFPKVLNANLVNSAT